jgi:hypothetical protein
MASGTLSPEAKARENIDRQLTEAGWIVQTREQTNVSAGRGVAIGEFPVKSGYGEADYLLYVDGIPAGVVEAKKEGQTLSGFEIQTEKYSVGLPDELKPYRKPREDRRGPVFHSSCPDSRPRGRGFARKERRRRRDARTTLQKYGHVVGDAQRRAVETLAERIERHAAIELEPSGEMEPSVA